MPSSTSPNGMIASVVIPEKITSAGPIANSSGTAAVGPELLLAGELEDVGDRLQQPVRADPVRAVAVLEAADQLALDDGQHRDDHEHAEEDQDRLDDHDPGRLREPDLGERQRHHIPFGSFAPAASPAGSGGPAATTSSWSAGFNGSISTIFAPFEPVRVLLARSPRSGTPPPAASARGSSPAPSPTSRSTAPRPRRPAQIPSRSASASADLDPLLRASGTAAPRSARSRRQPRARGRSRVAGLRQRSRARERSGRTARAAAVLRRARLARPAVPYCSAGPLPSAAASPPCHRTPVPPISSGVMPARNGVSAAIAARASRRGVDAGFVAEQGARARRAPARSGGRRRGGGRRGGGAGGGRRGG